MRNYLSLVILFNLLLAANSFAASSYQSLTDNQKNYWLKLLHYHEGKSRADGENFFLSKNGKTNPEEEFSQNIEVFSKEESKAGWFNYNAQCVFRERYRFIKSLGFLKNAKEVPCLEFEEWKKGLNAGSITLVFSSSYPNNPSSLFGHTLIRINQKDKKEKNKSDILDYAIAFSAIPNADDIGIIFAYKGLFGGYKGLLEVTKYYTKVNEYNNGESRDLIEYDIQTSDEELEKLINHLWEIYQTTYFDYFFTDENCSAVLVDILAVAFDENISKRDRWYYLPAEMIKHFYKETNRVMGKKYRPALKKQLEKKLNYLNQSELVEMKKISSDKNFPEDYSNTKVLDAVIDYLDFEKYRTKDKLTNNQKIIFRRALLRRSALDEITPYKIEDYDEGNRPELGHEPQKIISFAKLEKSDFLLGVEFKEGYHDLLNNDVGFDPFSQFDFLGGKISYNLNKKIVNIENIRIVNLISLHPYTFFDPQFSWDAHVEYNRIYDLDCRYCKKIDLKAIGGFTFVPTKNSRLSLMAGAILEMSEHFKNNLRIGPGFNISFYSLIHPKWKIGLVDEVRMDAINKVKKDFYNQFDFKVSHFTSLNQEARFELTNVSKFKSFKSNIYIGQLSYGHFF